MDAAGNVYIREKARVRKVTPAGIISTFAGNGTNGFSGDGGPATSAKLGLGPQRAGLATDSAGNLYIADSNNYRVRKVDTSGTITTVAGNGQIGLGSSGNGNPATSVALCFPSGVAVDHAGNLYIGSSICGGVRKVDPAGVITTVAQNSAGPSYGVAVDSGGLLYLNAGGVPSQIRRVNANGTITVVAGTGTGTTFSGMAGQRPVRNSSRLTALRSIRPGTSSSPIAATAASARWIRPESLTPLPAMAALARAWAAQPVHHRLSGHQLEI